MIWHFLVVLGNENRIARAAAAALLPAGVRTLRPVPTPRGYPATRRARGRQVPAVAARFLPPVRGDAFRVRTLASGKRLVRRAGRPAKRALRRFAARGRDRLMRVYYRIQLLMPRGRVAGGLRRVLVPRLPVQPGRDLREGARDGAGGARGVGGQPGPGRGHARRASTTWSPARWRTTARWPGPRWLINNVNFPDFVVKRPGSVHVMTHHGTPLKVMGLDQYAIPRGRSGGRQARGKTRDIAARLMRRCDRWDFSITQNAFTTQVWERAYPCRYETLEVGYPRNDRLANATPEQVRVAREKVGIPDGKTVVLYAPTHREYHTELPAGAGRGGVRGRVGAGHGGAVPGALLLRPPGLCRRRPPRT